MRNAICCLFLCLLLPASVGANAPARIARTDVHGDPLPPGAIARMGTLRLRHADAVASVTFAPGGKFVAAGGPDKVVRVWHAESGKEIARFSAHTGQFWQVAFTPDGKWLASPGKQHILHLWEVARLGEADLKPRELAASGVYVLSPIVFSPDSKLLFSGTTNNLVCVWELATGRELRRFGHKFHLTASISSLAVTTDGKRLATAHLAYADEKPITTIHLWDPVTGEHVRAIATIPRYVQEIAFSPDGQAIAAASREGPRLWQVETGKALSLAPTVTQPCDSVAFAHDGRTLFAGGGGFLRGWSLPSGREDRAFDMGSKYVYSIAVSPDGKTLATGHGNNNAVSLWDAETGKPRLNLIGHHHSVNAVLFTPGSKALVTAAGRELLRWDLAGKSLGQWKIPPRNDPRIVLSPDGKVLALDGGQLRIVLLDAATAKERRRLTHPLPPLTWANNPMTFTFTPDSQRVISAPKFLGDHHLRVWEEKTGKELSRIDTGEGTAHGNPGLVVSPDGRILYVASRTDPIRVIDVATGKERGRIGGGRMDPTELALSADGRRIAASLSTEVLVWDTGSGALVRQFLRPQGRSAYLVFSPDGRMIAEQREGEPVRLWEIASGQLRLEISGHAAAVQCVAFTEAGRLLATGSADTTALLWDMHVVALGDQPLLTNLDNLWTDLASDDARAAFRAIAGLHQLQGKSVELLSERLKPMEPKALDRLIAQLDSNVYQVREQAIRKLKALGWLAEPAMNKAMAGKPSAEVRQRIGVIRAALVKNPSHDPARLRAMRAVEVLEGIATPDARRVLEAVSSTVPASELVIEAQAALARLSKLPQWRKDIP